MDVPEGIKINMIENDPSVAHTIILPPEQGAVKDEELDQIAGGRGGGCRGQDLSF